MFSPLLLSLLLTHGGIVLSLDQRYVSSEGEKKEQKISERGNTDEQIGNLVRKYNGEIAENINPAFGACIGIACINSVTSGILIGATLGIFVVAVMVCSTNPWLSVLIFLPAVGTALLEIANWAWLGPVTSIAILGSSPPRNHSAIEKFKVVAAIPGILLSLAFPINLSASLLLRGTGKETADDLLKYTAPLPLFSLLITLFGVQVAQYIAINSAS